MKKLCYSVLVVVVLICFAGIANNGVKVKAFVEYPIEVTPSPTASSSTNLNSSSSSTTVTTTEMPKEVDVIITSVYKNDKLKKKDYKAVSKKKGKIGKGYKLTAKRNYKGEYYDSVAIYCNGKKIGTSYVVDAKDIKNNVLNIKVVYTPTVFKKTVVHQFKNKKTGKVIKKTSTILTTKLNHRVTYKRVKTAKIGKKAVKVKYTNAKFSSNGETWYQNEEILRVTYNHSYTLTFYYQY